METIREFWILFQTLSKMMAKQRLDRHLRSACVLYRKQEDNLGTTDDDPVHRLAECHTSPPPLFSNTPSWNNFTSIRRDIQNIPTLEYEISQPHTKVYDMLVVWSM